MGNPNISMKRSIDIVIHLLRNYITDGNLQKRLSDAGGMCWIYTIVIDIK